MKHMPRRIFTEEFKKEAVRLFKEQDLTLAEVSRHLDIDPKSLKSWVTLYDAGALKGSLGVTKLNPDQLCIRELERELAIAREERDILKKAIVAFFRMSRSSVVRFNAAFNLMTSCFKAATSLFTAGCFRSSASLIHL